MDATFEPNFDDCLPPWHYDPAYVYCLRDPDTNDVRYIGVTMRIEQRRYRHSHPDNVSPLKVVEWCRQLKRRGLKPTLEVLRQINAGDWLHEERATIQEYAAKYPGQLLNVAGMPNESELRRDPRKAAAS